MDNLTLRIKVGEIIDNSEFEIIREEPPEVPDVFVDKSEDVRIVQFVLDESSCGCDSDTCPSQVGEFNDEGLTELELPNGDSIALPDVLSVEFLAERPMSFEIDGTHINLYYEDCY